MMPHQPNNQLFQFLVILSSCAAFPFYQDIAEPIGAQQQTAAHQKVVPQKENNEMEVKQQQKEFFSPSAVGTVPNESLERQDSSVEEAALRAPLEVVRGVITQMEQQDDDEPAVREEKDFHEQMDFQKDGQKDVKELLEPVEKARWIQPSPPTTTVDVPTEMPKPTTLDELLKSTDNPYKKEVTDGVPNVKTLNELNTTIEGEKKEKLDKIEMAGEEKLKMERKMKLKEGDEKKVEESRKKEHENGTEGVVKPDTGQQKGGERHNDGGGRHNDGGERHNDDGERHNDGGERHNDGGERHNDDGERHNDGGERHNDGGERHNPPVIAVAEMPSAEGHFVRDKGEDEEESDTKNDPKMDDDTDQDEESTTTSIEVEEGNTRKWLAAFWDKVVLGMRCARQDCRDTLIVGGEQPSMRIITGEWKITRRARSSRQNGQRGGDAAEVEIVRRRICHCQN